MRQRFKNDLIELTRIIAANEKKGIKSGPIVLGLHKRIAAIFNN